VCDIEVAGGVRGGKGPKAFSPPSILVEKKEESLGHSLTGFLEEYPCLGINKTRKNNTYFSLAKELRRGGRHLHLSSSSSRSP